MIGMGVNAPCAEKYGTKNTIGIALGASANDAEWKIRKSIFGIKRPAHAKDAGSITTGMAVPAESAVKRIIPGTDALAGRAGQRGITTINGAISRTMTWYAIAAG